MQGEDLAVWITAQRTAWDRLVPAQQYLLETVGIDPAEDEPVRPVARSQDDQWTANLTAAKQFHAREGHLMVPRKHVEIVDGTEHRPGHGSTTPGEGQPSSVSGGGRTWTRSTCVGSGELQRLVPHQTTFAP
ncbi:helicase associated domain-containing protein [Streptomyces triticisoli]|jgi:hypothetical protein|uniref:helicase associated domain-containing protein n=1 Tax=Streptomyces triticisoli TaxID=2182797 RepID=UPI001E426BD8|nr:helicase associated domain-containing protein [Streptomyces triticisoli]